MSKKESRKLDVLRRLEKGQLTQVQAGKILQLGTRQIRRLQVRLAVEGVSGLPHRRRGVTSCVKTDASVVSKVVALRRDKYEGFNDRHFVEKLSQNEELNLGRETVRRILRAAGIGSPRKRRRIKHRARRERRAQAGMMILWDGSRHDWLEGRGPILTLMGAIDDATNEMLPGMRFYLQESAEGYLRLLYEIARNKGLPQSAYGDKHGSLCRNDDHWSLEEELRGEQDPTQVGEAMRALCIEKIDAHSPQAKGRIERPWGTLQDRLVSELRLAKVSTLEHANAILERERISHNQRFAIPAREHATAWRPLPKTLDLERACSFRYEATVKNDNTVQIAHYIINIPPGPKGRTYAKAQVEVRQLLDGTWRVYLKDVIIATAPRENIGELRVKKPRKRNAASRAFRKAVIAI
jgi:hypothetical protein